MLPSSRVPGVCPGGGMVLDEIDTCITNENNERETRRTEHPLYQYSSAVILTSVLSLLIPTCPKNQGFLQFYEVWDPSYDKFENSTFTM